MDLLSDLEQHSGILLKSFQKKFLIVNPEKYHLLL